MAEGQEARREFLEVNEIHIHRDGTVTLYPHVGPEGFVGERVRVRASKVKCWWNVKHVLHDVDITSVFMRKPVTCTLEEEEDTLVCG